MDVRQVLRLYELSRVMLPCPMYLLLLMLQAEAGKPRKTSFLKKSRWMRAFPEAAATLLRFAHLDMDLCGLRAALKLTEHQDLPKKATSAANGVADSQNDVPLSMTFCAKKGGVGRLSPCHDLGYHTLLTRTPTPPPLDVSPKTVVPAIPPSTAYASPSSPYGDLAALLAQTAAASAGSSSSISPSLASPQPPRVESRPTSWSDIPSSRSSPFPFPQESSSESSRAPSVGRGSSLSDTDRLITTFKGKKVPKSCHFDRLTDDLILKIFSYLSSNQLCLSARVCRRWYFLAWEPQLWTSITLSGEKIHVDRGLKTLFRLLCRDSPTVCLAVERISLSGCRRLTDKGLYIVAVRCPELKTLELRGCINVTNNGVSDVVSRCHNLARLDATGCLSVTTINIRPLTPDSASTSSSQQQLLSLQYLDLTDCQNVEDADLLQIAQNCPQLSHLYLRRCARITDAGLKAVASYCPLLRELSVSDCICVTDFGLYELAKLGPNLRYLSVAKCDQVSDAGIKQIARHCYKLRYLNVRGCEAVSDDAMEVIAKSCSRLRALDIGKCDVTDNGLKFISQNCINLRKLSVKSCEMITDNGIQIIAYYCRGLQQLNIQDCHITSNGYRIVKKFCKKCIIEHTNPGFS